MNKTVTVELTNYTYGHGYDAATQVCPNAHCVGPTPLAEYRVTADGQRVLSCASCLPATVQFAARGRIAVLAS